MRNWLKELRKQKGMLQKEVAEKIGLTQSNYNMIEKGERQDDMSLSIIEKLSEVFDVSILYIIEQEQKRKEAV